MKSIFRFKISLLFLILYNNIYAQNNLTGKIVDSKGVPISFANIGILNKAIGTVSDENGNFAISFGDNLLTDTMIISCFGFKRQTSLVKTFIDSLLKNKNITMENEVFQLGEVPIKGDKVKPYKIGHFTNSWATRGYMTSRAKGAELATTIYQDKNKTIHLIAFRLNIIKNDFDSLRFRINIYSVKNQLPDSNLLSQNEIFLLLKDHDEFKYNFKKNIFITGDFIISLELLDTFGQSASKKVFEFTAQQGGRYFKRFTSHDKWEKFNGASLGYGLIVN
jgi:hypothetical protein